MLIAIVLDRPLAEAQALVNTPDAFIQALTTTIQDKKNHPVIAQMIQPDTSDDAAPAEDATSSSRSYSQRAAKARPNTFAYPIPIRTRGQREVLPRPRLPRPNVRGVTGHHGVPMVGQYIFDPAEVAK